MKTYITLIIAACIASSAFAAKGDSTKEQFLAEAKKQAETKPWKFNLEKAEATFKAIDTNKDGIASGAEKQTYWKSQKLQEK